VARIAAADRSADRVIVFIRRCSLNSQPARGPEASDKDKGDLSRRDLFAKFGLLLNGLAVTVLAVPVVGYLLSPIVRGENGRYKSWVSLGELDEFPEGQTRLAKYQNPVASPWDGDTANIPCWVRRLQGEQFQVFAINCAHLGCPVRWFAQSGLFMCPCHGGVYYQDGSRASGPPPRGLFEYAYKVENGKLMIEAGIIPTLSTTASLREGKTGCQG
jgi:Rieske Fe-S protein